METKLERIQNDIEQLSQFNATPGNGLSRFTFTEQDRGAREYIKSQMKEAGLHVREDAAGTIVGRLEGEMEGPVVMIGSHFDSVKNGGNFDGQAGVVTGLEIARTMHDKGIKPKYPIEFIAMIEEEGTRFGGGLFASRAMVGALTETEVQTFKDAEGITIAQAMKNFGLDPDKIKDAVRKPEDIKAFVELHIEQGPILEAENIEVGLVEVIVGIKQIEVVINGRPDHAGTTPMPMRADALTAAASVFTLIDQAAREAGEGTVATVGKLSLLPGAANIVPGKVTFTVDIRSKRADCIVAVENKIRAALAELSKDPAITTSVEDKLVAAPVNLDEGILEMERKYCNELGFSNKVMLSGAGHDAMIMAGIARVGLIFVQSKNGRSHCPEEWTDYDKLQKGIEVAYKTILELAEV